MTIPTDQNQVQEKNNNKELNFRALEQKYERQLEQERGARFEAERLYKESIEHRRPHEPETYDPDEYIDHKKLNKKLEKFTESTQKNTQQEVQQAVQQALKEERRNTWLKANSDFDEIMSHTEDFYKNDPELAETILEMPDGFERTKLVYKNIKALGLHRPKSAEPSIQQKVDANRRHPGYQPNSVGSSPYSQQGDFSLSGQKQAYEKMKQLQNQLRL